MFLKLFKHDWKSLSRWLVPVLIGIGGAAVLGFINALVLGATGSGNTDGRTKEALLFSTFTGTALIAMALAAALTVIAVLIFVKFYKSMVTDEAYLTFTLPVSAGRLIGAKFLSAALWTVIGAAAVFAAWIVILSGIWITGGSTLRGEVGEITRDLFDMIWENPQIMIPMFAYALTGAVRVWFQVTCAILFGASVVRKNKALAAVGMVLAVNFAVNTILSLFGIAGMFSIVMGASYGITQDSGELTLPAVLWIQSGVNVLLTAVFWWWSVRIARKSVNIE
ncbi:MAG: hypothetical protein IIU08_06100 [Clostridia bacterium]|nr:hypothetical protein [Clostridia bacterium]